MKRRNSGLQTSQPPLFDRPPSPSATPPTLSPLPKDGNRNHRRGFLAPDGTQHRTPSSKTVDQLMAKLLVPKYVTLSKSPPKLSRTRTTLRARVLEFELYTGEHVGSSSDSGSSRGSSSSDSDESPDDAPVLRRSSHSTESRLEYYESGVLRRVTVPENYSIAHIHALVCMVMGWPLATAIATSILPAYRSESTAHRWGLPDEKEVWLHLMQSEDEEAASSIGGKRRPEERVRLSDVWPTIMLGQTYKDMQAQRRDLYGLDTARIVSRFISCRPSEILIAVRWPAS